MSERLYLNVYRAPVNIFGGIEIRAALEEECEECDSSEPPMMQSAGSVYATLNGVEYSRAFNAFWYLDADEYQCRGEFDFDGAQWEVWDDSRREFREAAAAEVDALAAACLSEEYAGTGESPADALETLANNAAGEAVYWAAEKVSPALRKIAAHISAVADESMGVVLSIPAWALCALTYGDYDGLSEEDCKMIDAWIEAQDDIDVTRFSSVNQDDEGRYYFPDFNASEEINRFFDDRPAFGLPTECESVYFLYKHSYTLK